MKQIALTLTLTLVALVAFACTTRCDAGAICGDYNTIAPTAVSTTTTTNPTPTPSASPTPGCVAQTAPFTCISGTPIFEAILLDVQRTVIASPQPIYVAALVEALNKNAAICAQAGPSDDEVTIKARTSNTLSETWDVVRADGLIQAIPAPNNICTPARF